MENAQFKTKQIVKNYKMAYSDEFSHFIIAIKQKQSQMHNAFGATKGSNALERKVLELPENLVIMLRAGLNDDEYLWLFNPNDPKCLGIKWFARTFPEFRAAEKL